MGNEERPGKKILVADISQTIRRLMKGYLQDTYEVIEAVTGAQVVSIINSHHLCDSTCLQNGESGDAGGESRLTAIIMSLEFPDHNAFELAGVIRKYHSMDCLPIIFSTSNNRRDIVLKALENGVNDVIVKPFPRELLISKIQKLGHEISPYEKKKSALVSKIPFFHGVPESQIAYILNTCSETVDKRKGETLCRQGDENYDLYILLEGKCDVLYNDRKVAEITPIDTIGEMGFVAHDKRSATVMAAAPSTVVVINKDRFDDYLNEERAISETILKNIIFSLNDRIRKSNELIKRLKMIAEEYLSH